MSTVADAARLTVTVQDIRRGEIRLALYATSESFSDFSAELASQTAKARPGRVTITFENLVPGQYAVAAYHDENGNGDFDSNFFGLPQEGYGFSNDAPVVFGPPTFEDAALLVRGQQQEAAVSIIY